MLTDSVNSTITLGDSIVIHHVCYENATKNSEQHVTNLSFYTDRSFTPRAITPMFPGGFFTHLVPSVRVTDRVRVNPQKQE